MGHTKTLVVDNDTESLKTILATLADAKVLSVVTDSNEAAWDAFQADPEISLVLVRGSSSEKIRATEFCKQLRSVKARDTLSIIVMLKENELARGAETLIAGASDLLIDPFEPRELRMRAGIVPAEQERRVDRAHTMAELAPGKLAQPRTFLPEFEADTMRIGFGAMNSQVAAWKSAPKTRQIPLDRIIVCPECEAIPTFRPGCGSCGSAFVEQEVLIHHFACAHVGPESEFQSGSGLACPKCRLNDLIAGSDFEQIQGCLKCSDCDAIFAEAKTLGHCLSCQHRFAVEDGKLIDVVGYQVGVSAESALITAPNFQTAGSRKPSNVEA